MKNTWYVSKDDDGKIVAEKDNTEQEYKPVPIPLEHKVLMVGSAVIVVVAAIIRFIIM